MSGVMSKIWTAIRGGAREVGESVVDANGIRIFEQEIRDAKDSIAKAKSSLTEVMANKMQSARKVNQLREQIREHEGYVAQALNKGDEALAMEIAQKIADFEPQLVDQQTIVARLESQIDQLKKHVQNAEKTIADHERELAIVKTTESVQKATVQVTDNISANNSGLTSARSSLERIKKRQQMTQDKMEAGDVLSAELSGSDLDAKLKAAGITDKKSDASEIGRAHV